MCLGVSRNPLLLLKNVYFFIVLVSEKEKAIPVNETSAVGHVIGLSPQQEIFCSKTFNY